MHLDTNYAAMDRSMKEHSEFLPACFKDEHNLVTRSNLWYPLDVMHNGQKYDKCMGTHLMGAMAFSLSNKSFLEERESPDDSAEYL
jgi:hypothetical protein